MELGRLREKRIRDCAYFRLSGLRSVGTAASAYIYRSPNCFARFRTSRALIKLVQIPVFKSSSMGDTPI